MIYAFKYINFKRTCDDRPERVENELHIRILDNNNHHHHTFRETKKKEDTNANGISIENSVFIWLDDTSFSGLFSLIFFLLRYFSCCHDDIRKFIYYEI